MTNEQRIVGLTWDQYVTNAEEAAQKALRALVEANANSDSREQMRTNNLFGAAGRALQDLDHILRSSGEIAASGDSPQTPPEPAPKEAAIAVEEAAGAAREGMRTGVDLQA